ncbi:MAG: C25 family cysteine peptidase [Verrucomicrobiota bacterium]
MRLTILGILLGFLGVAAYAGVQSPSVVLRACRAEVRNDQVVVQWQTAADSGIIYFDLFRCQPGQSEWVKINETVVISSNSLAGATYEVVDATARPFQTYLYRLVQTDQQGKLGELGPFELKSVPGTEAVSKATLVGSVPGMPAVTGAKGVTAMGIPSLSALDGTTFVKITTAGYGIQSVSASDLSGLLGQPLDLVKSAISQGWFQLASSGLPVTYLATPDGNSLLFYAEAHLDNYSTNNIYWLTSQTNPPVSFLNGQAPLPNPAAAWYSSGRLYWNDAGYYPSLPVGPEDDAWMWRQFVSGIPGNNTLTNLPIVIDHLSPGPDRPAQLSIQLMGGIAATHFIQVIVNANNVLGQWSWSGVTPTNLNVTIPSAWLLSGTNQLTLVAITNGTPIRSTWYLNRFTLSYPRTYTATNGLIDFTANNNASITLDGFTSPDLTLLDVTNPKQPVVITNCTVDQPAATYRLSFIPAGPAAHCVAYQSGAAASVSALALARTAGLSARSNAADYVIVSPPSLLSAATNLADYRRQTGLRTIIAPLDQVYNEFASGFPTPHAIQSLLAMAWTNWAVRPHYCVLLGKGTYDFRDLLQKHDNLTPPLFLRITVDTQSSLFPSDSLMGEVNGDGLPEIAVGRLSGLTTNDLIALINRIKNYESMAPVASPQAMLIADAPGAAGDFTGDLLLVDAVLTNKFTDTLVLSTNATNAALLHGLITNQWRQGVDFVNYVGHGAIDRFGTYGYLTSADTNNLNCANYRLPVVAAMTCIAGLYSNPGNNCLGECLGQPAAGGAIAFFGPSGYSNDGEASQLNIRFAALLRANAGLGLGDLILQAIADHIRLDLPSIPVWECNLLGDPALHYNISRNLLPLQIAGITPTLLEWSGGLPPYQLEWTTNLLTGWQPLGPPLLDNFTTYTNRGNLGFFRVRGGQ